MSLFTSYDGFGRKKTTTTPEGIVARTSYKACGTVYAHPNKTCSNGADSCTTPWVENTTSPLPGGYDGARQYGCGLGWDSGSDYCWGNSWNGVCPSSLTKGTFDVAEGRIGGVHESALLCYPANVPIESDSTCPANATFVITTEMPGRPVQRQYADALGREVRTASSPSLAIDANTVLVDTTFNGDGLVAKKTLPYFSGQTARATSYAYDAMGRPTRITAPDASTESIAYSGLTTTSTSREQVTAKTVTTTKVTNAAGKLVRVTDNKGGVVSYSYDPFDNLVETRDPAGNVTKIAYDNRGRRVSLDDPDLGLIKYGVNSFGETVSEETPRMRAMGVKTTMRYDALGRMIERVDAASDASSLRQSYWTYDSLPDGTCTNAKGKLCRATTISLGYERRYTYDTLGRLSTEKVTVENTSHVTSTTYDPLGRVDVVTYPNGLGVRSAYHATRGYLESLTDVASGTVYWRATTVDAGNAVTTEALGNGVTSTSTLNPATRRLTAVRAYSSAGDITRQNFTWDAFGNLKQRQDVKNGLTETFAYDELNRLTAAKATFFRGVAVGTTPPVDAPKTMTLSYGAIGNIVSKSDTGSYAYAANPSGLRVLPHAVSSTTVKGHYNYDLDGNMTAGGGRTLTWTSYNQPVTISGASGAYAQFSYGPERQRIRQTSNTEKTYYLGGYEKVIRGTETLHKVYIGGTAVVTTRGSGAKEIRYLHKDHLGSVIAITNESGALVESFSFDAFGKRRKADGSALTETAQYTQPLSGITRGYTGHEMLDNLGLAHMNARIQDPELGRFLSADTIIDGPETTQGYNRYSYVHNNPLSYSDPSGHGFFETLLRIAVAIVVVVIAWYVVAALSLTGLAAAVVGGAIMGAAIGFAVTYTLTGNFKAALRAGFQGAIYGAVSGFCPGGMPQCLWNGLVQGVATTIQGGDFVQGFITGVATTLLAPQTQARAESITSNVALRVAIGAAGSAVVGGTMAVIGGGKFENGATSAAISYVYGQIGQAAAKADADHARSRPRAHPESTGAMALVGGCGDRTIEGPMWQAYLEFIEANPTANAYYFEWTESDRIAAWIDRHHGDVYAHSYGADTVTQLVAAGHQVSRLYTIDPVSWVQPNLADVRANSSTWYNYEAADKSFNLPNAISAIGGRWGNSVAPYADAHYLIPQDHANVVDGVLFTAGASRRFSWSFGH